MITQRLQAVINYAKGDIIADIGTDHAYIPVRLIEEKKAKKVIASDIKQGPADAAKKTILKYNMENKIEVRIGSGLSVLEEGEADTIIIAGMGGMLIRDIIIDGRSKIKGARLILQPMNGQYELRKYLLSSGFEIEKEDISVEGFKVYNLLSVKEGNGVPFENEIFYHLPPYLKKNKNFKALYEKKEREFVKIINGLENSKEKDLKKLELYKNLYNNMKEYYKL